VTSFDGKVALVTGGAQGIGHATAVELLRRGARVAIADIDGELAASVAADLDPDGERVLAVTVDVSRRADVAAAVDACVSRWGSLDAMVAHAGITDFRPLVDTDDDVWDRVLAVNLTGALHCIREAARVMDGGGAIVATGSTNAFWVEGGAAAYNASKGGLTALVRTAAVELAPRGVRVNVVHPGIVDTRISAFVVHDEANAAEVLARIPAGRFAEPADIARVIAFLASDDAAYVNGAELIADGGMTAGVPFPLPDTPDAGGGG
jgi:NAD(P)-dependent dehydrogenase (short-subunit alcohol dehydrogenase family)